MPTINRQYFMTVSWVMGTLTCVALGSCKNNVLIHALYIHESVTQMGCSVVRLIYYICIYI